MAGFRKASAPQAALKMSMYGLPGSGKTYTSLLFGEGLAALSGKRVAFVDTEMGTAFYSKDVPERKHHPKAFDFDALYTRSLTEVLSAVKSLKPAEHAVIIVDSMTHLWEACKASYTGRTNKVGQIPFHAWGKIKAPYKELMAFLINSPFHVFILGRQGNEFAEDEETGESKAVGVKMKAEGETAYEPHICLRMEGYRTPGKPIKSQETVITAHVEKDRTGILQGKSIAWPGFDSVCRPLLHLLGHEQAQLPSDEDAAAKDSEAIAAEDRERAKVSSDTRRMFEGKFMIAKTREEVEAASKEITPDIKKKLFKEDTEALRNAYLSAVDRVKNGSTA